MTSKQESTVLWPDKTGSFIIFRPGSDALTPTEEEAQELLRVANTQLDSKHSDSPEPYATESLSRGIPVVIFE